MTTKFNVSKKSNQKLNKQSQKKTNTKSNKKQSKTYLKTRVKASGSKKKKSSKSTSIITTPSSLNPLILKANKLDSHMKETGKKTYHNNLEAKDLYPLIIVTHGGSKYEFKRTKNDNLKRFSTLDGFMDIFNWSKGVCHLTIWIHMLLSMYKNDKGISDEWKINAQTQQQNIKDTLDNLPVIRKLLVGINNQTIATDTLPQTDDISVKLVSTPEDYIKYAKLILTKVDRFITTILNKNSIELEDVKKLMQTDNLMNDASWLFNATIYPLQHRAVQSIKKWQCMTSPEIWKKLNVVISSGMPSQGGLGQSRGNCLTGGTAVATLKPFMTNDIKKNVIIVTTNNISLKNVNDVIPEIKIAQKIVTNSKNSNSDNNSKLLFEALDNPSNALALGFTESTTNNLFKNTKKCPFHKIKN